MTLTYSRSLLLVPRPVKAEITEPCWRKRHGTKAGRRVETKTSYVVTRGYIDTKSSDDYCHHRRPQLLVPLTKHNQSSVYSSDKQNRSTNVDTISAVITIVTQRIKEKRHNRNTGVCHRNLIAIKPERECFKSAKQLTLFSLNSRSVKNKALSIADLVISRNIDILAMAETWLDIFIDAL